MKCIHIRKMPRARVCTAGAGTPHCWTTEALSHAAADTAVASSHLAVLAASQLKNRRVECQPSLLAIGVLSMPAPARSKQRLWHRAAHGSQGPVRASRICFRYLFSDAEMAGLASMENDEIAAENATHGDLLQLPDVPRGPLRRVVTAPTAARGGQCVLKILAWLQHATRHSSAPFVAYGDDDTFWGVQRVDGTFSLLRDIFGKGGRDGRRLRLYAGAMQFHSWWDHREMKAHGWGFSMPEAARDFETSFNAARAMPPLNSSHTSDDRERIWRRARRFHRPYAMAHGLGVILSRALAMQVPASTAVTDFFALYRLWLESPAALDDDEMKRAATASKCRLGTDSTFGALVAALADENAGWPLVALDMLNFNMNWPWPLPNRAYGDRAQQELNDLHAFQLYAGASNSPVAWMHLYNISVGHEAMPAASATAEPRLHCRHAPDALSSAALLRHLVERGVARNVSDAPRKRGAGWLARHPHAAPPTSSAQQQPRLDPHEWLFCGIECLEEGRGTAAKCQRAWSGLRRRL